MKGEWTKAKIAGLLKKANILEYAIEVLDWTDELLSVGLRVGTGYWATRLGKTPGEALATLGENLELELSRREDKKRRDRNDWDPR